MTSDQHPMHQLSKRLDAEADLFLGDLVLLDYPVHPNVGDMLIWRGAEYFLKRNRKNIIGQYSLRNFSSGANRKTLMCDTICLSGGGNLGDLWPHHQLFREEIITRFPGKRIVILPQSVHFTDSASLFRACNIFRAHKNLHILVRDKGSFAVLEGQGISNLRLCPDMAHALWGHLRSPAPGKHDRLYFLRRDKEVGSLPEDVQAMQHEGLDWEDYQKGWTGSLLEAAKKVVLKDGKRENRLPAYTAWRMACDILIWHTVRKFAQHQTIVTNRLHAVILSALIGRRVLAYDNCYGKLSSYISCWLKNISNVEMRFPS